MINDTIAVVEWPSSTFNLGRFPTLKCIVPLLGQGIAVSLTTPHRWRMLIHWQPLTALIYCCWSLSLHIARWFSLFLLVLGCYCYCLFLLIAPEVSLAWLIRSAWTESVPWWLLLFNRYLMKHSQPFVASHSWLFTNDWITQELLHATPFKNPGDYFPYSWLWLAIK